MSAKTTHVRHLDLAVAWDESEQRHVYLSDADLVFCGSEILHVGPGYAEVESFVQDEMPEPPIM